MKKIYSIFIAVVSLTAIVACSSDDSVTLSALNSIESFTINFEGIPDEEIIYDLGNDIIVSVPFGTSLDALVAAITVSEGATITPSPAEAINYINGEAVTFVVTAEDGTSTKTYTVTINLRGEVGSGSRIKSLTYNDSTAPSPDNRVVEYTYNDANFIVESVDIEDSYGTIIYEKISYTYNDLNQVIEQSIDNDQDVDGDDERVVFTYEDGIIVSSETFTKEDDFAVAISSTTYQYNDLGRIEAKTTSVPGEADNVVTNTYDANGNMLKNDTGIEYSTTIATAFDDKNNPFAHVYPAAFGKIIQTVERGGPNNPSTYESPAYDDNKKSYTYNTDNYPLTIDYSYFGFIFVTQTIVYN
ncbi:hypothetical protein [Flavivirga spongiicola]|uniref:DUF5018 domain-containing protein n=1 Tax=Flavivirga spongiicola TaxID=421621 RepID=A0ABU7XMH1_9FLAO|nr:hypothetical protein [Flavivirga sp. MEBiC05379]MDO5981380.1 hypothetical protein [Flavivirga sp. MEBiC05379]